MAEPNSIAFLNGILFISSIQCGIYQILLKDINFSKVFASPNFFSPFDAKLIPIFEDIILKEIIGIAVNTASINDDCITEETSNVDMFHFYNNDNCYQSTFLLVIDDECKLYLIKISDLTLTSFGNIDSAQHLIYYSYFDMLYISCPDKHCIQCLSNIYHEIIGISNVAIPLVGESERKESEYDSGLKLKQKRDIQSLMLTNKSSSMSKICFPKSIFLVYEKKTVSMMNGKRLNKNHQNIKHEHSLFDNKNMEILVEIGNMLQSYMLAELRLNSKKYLSYVLRNYVFLYLYTSPLDGESVYRELDVNYEGSVPAVDLIQDSSIGPVILVKLKAPTKEQIRKEKQKEKYLIMRNEKKNNVNHRNKYELK